MGKDFYAILGINRSATDTDVKHRSKKVVTMSLVCGGKDVLHYNVSAWFSYRKLALKFHPVKNESVGAEEKFAEVAEAYDVLSNRKSSYIPHYVNILFQGHNHATCIMLSIVLFCMPVWKKDLWYIYGMHLVKSRSGANHRQGYI